jgi:hypothetical protein
MTIPHISVLPLTTLVKRSFSMHKAIYIYSQALSVEIIHTAND